MAKTSMNLPEDFIAVDLETTGLDTQCCEIIEVSLVTVVGFEVTKRFSTLIKPSGYIPSFITMLTGITNDMVKSAPSIAEIIGSIAGVLDGSVIVGHNVCFDDRFLQKAFADAGLSCSYSMVDTLRFSRHVFKNLNSRDLDSVADACNLDIDVASRHRALSDAEIAARCAIEMWPLVKKLYGDNPDAKVTKRSHVDTSFDDLKPTVDEIDESNPFYGSNILITGKMSGMKRAEAAQKAVNLGAVPLKGFSRKVDFLVVGSFDYSANFDGVSSGKMKKAEKAIADGSPMQIVSESFFAEFASEV